MNKVVLNKTVDDYKLFIFDLDGTLYYQKPFRVRMLLFLLGYVIRHPASWKDLLIVKSYREVREDWERICAALTEEDGGASLDERQFGYVAKKENVPVEKVKKAVALFIMDAPLALLPAFCDTRLKSWIHQLRECGRKVVIYSDYPAEDKLKALQIETDAVYTSADERINSMKPDPKGIETILGDFGISREDALMIGDRYEKDAVAAEKNGVDYLVLSARKREREKLEEVLLKTN